jgi:hypothetical protein
VAVSVIPVRHNAGWPIIDQGKSWGDVQSGIDYAVIALTASLVFTAASRLKASMFELHNDSSAFCCDFAPLPADFKKARVEQWS